VTRRGNNNESRPSVCSRTSRKHSGIVVVFAFFGRKGIVIRFAEMARKANKHSFDRAARECTGREIRPRRGRSKVVSYSKRRVGILFTFDGDLVNIRARLSSKYVRRVYAPTNAIIYYLNVRNNGTLITLWPVHAETLNPGCFH